MIVDAILTVLMAPVQWILDALPTITWPAFFQTSGPGSLPALMADWGSHLGTLNGWFPVTAFLGGIEILFTVAAAAITIKVARILVSLFTGGGGSAA